MPASAPADQSTTLATVTRSADPNDCLTPAFIFRPPLQASMLDPLAHREVGDLLLGTPIACLGQILYFTGSSDHATKPRSNT